jgi:nucleotide-binding universal stress UspA family protein
MFCFDGSEAARAVIPTVRMLASAPGSEVEIVRAVRVPAPRPTTGGGVSTTFFFGGATSADLHRVAAERRWEADQAHRQADIEFAAATARQECEALLPELPDGTRVNVLVTDREIPEALVDHARTDADIVVMSTHSRPPMVELFMGSVARALVASGAAPVTLVHPR